MHALAAVSESDKQQAVADQCTVTAILEKRCRIPEHFDDQENKESDVEEVRLGRLAAVIRLAAELAEEKHDQDKMGL